MNKLPLKLIAALVGLMALIGVVANPLEAALPDTIYQVEGTHIVVADLTDYAGDLGTRTDQIDLTSLAAGAARQSAKLDFGVNRAQLWDMYAAIEFAVAPVSQCNVDFYIGFSPSATAGTANPGGTSGSDAAYTGTAGDTLDDSLPQLDYIGSLFATSDATTVVQFSNIGWFKTPQRYGNLVVDNNCGQAFVADAVEMAVQIIPLETQIID